MFETPIAVVGRIITDSRRRVVAGQEVISFRVASNSRRRTAEGTWEARSAAARMNFPDAYDLPAVAEQWGRLLTEDA